MQRSLSEIVTVVGGGTPSTKNEKYWTGDINWFTPSEIGKFPFVYSSERKISELGLQKSSAKLLPKNKTILFTSRAGIGDTAILKEDASTNQGFQSLIVNDNTDIYFIYSMTEYIKKEALRKASGSTFLEISGKEMGKIKINVPRYNEQTKVGIFLKSLDSIITLEQEKLTQYICFKNALLQNMFPKRLQTRPKLRFKEFNDNWVNIRLGDIATLKNGYSFKSNSYESIGKYKIITISNVKGDLTVDTTEVKKINRLPKNIQPHQILNVGDILISMTGNVGRVSIIDEENTLLNQRVGVLVPKSIDFDINFILSILQTPKFEQSMINQGQGAAQLNISKKDIENFQFMIPSSSKERKLIGEEIASINRIILSLNSNIKFYKNLKKILLNNLFI